MAPVGLGPLSLGGRALSQIDDLPGALGFVSDFSDPVRPPGPKHIVDQQFSAVPFPQGLVTPRVIAGAEPTPPKARSTVAEQQFQALQTPQNQIVMAGQFPLVDMPMVWPKLTTVAQQQFSTVFPPLNTLVTVGRIALFDITRGRAWPYPVQLQDFTIFEIPKGLSAPTVFSAYESSARGASLPVVEQQFSVVQPPPGLVTPLAPPPVDASPRKAPFAMPDFSSVILRPAPTPYGANAFFDAGQRPAQPQQQIEPLPQYQIIPAPPFGWQQQQPFFTSQAISIMGPAGVKFENRASSAPIGWQAGYFDTATIGPSHVVRQQFDALPLLASAAQAAAPPIGWLQASPIFTQIALTLSGGGAHAHSESQAAVGLTGIAAFYDTRPVRPVALQQFSEQPALPPTPVQSFAFSKFYDLRANLPRQLAELAPPWSLPVTSQQVGIAGMAWFRDMDRAPPLKAPPPDFGGLPWAPPSAPIPILPPGGGGHRKPQRKSGRIYSWRDLSLDEIALLLAALDEED